MSPVSFGEIPGIDRSALQHLALCCADWSMGCCGKRSVLAEHFCSVFWQNRGLWVSGRVLAARSSPEQAARLVVVTCHKHGDTGCCSKVCKGLFPTVRDDWAQNPFIFLVANIFSCFSVTAKIMNLSCCSVCWKGPFAPSLPHQESFFAPLYWM